MPYESQKRYFKTEKGKAARSRANKRYYMKRKKRLLTNPTYRLRQRIRGNKYWIIPTKSYGYISRKSLGRMFKHAQ